VTRRSANIRPHATTTRPSFRTTSRIDGDYHAGDIVDELRQLRFDQNEFTSIQIDRDVRDFLVTSLSARQSRRT
jgi:hypothetical protein